MIKNETPFYKIQHRWDAKAQNNAAFPDQMNDQNNMVGYKKIGDERIKKYYDNFLVLKKENFDRNKINILD